MSTTTTDKRWDASLEALFSVLQREATARPTSRADAALDGGWHWRMLPDGVVVGVRTTGAPIAGVYRLELRIATELGKAEWEGRVAELVRGLGVRLATGKRPCPYVGALWAPLEPQARDEGKLVARYVMLAPGETGGPR